MLSRRLLLKSLLALPIVLGGGYALLSRPGYQEMIADIVKKKLGFLDLDPQGVAKFSSQFSEKYEKGYLKVLMIDISRRTMERFDGFPRLNDRVKVFENLVAEQFLKSSDFFVNGQDESRVVKYRDIAFADPYLTPCANPFAKFDS